MISPNLDEQYLMGYKDGCRNRIKCVMSFENYQYWRGVQDSEAYAWWHHNNCLRAAEAFKEAHPETWHNNWWRARDRQRFEGFWE